LLSQGDAAGALETARPAAATIYHSVGMRAQLLCGDAHFARKEYDAALAEYLKVTTIYPEVEDLTAQAHFRSGECTEQLGQKEMARTHFERVDQSYPNTEWAKRARERLGR
jgi:TolA-binding protein